MGDFNVGMSDNAMEGFCTLKNFESLIKKQTCYKNQTNLSCLDLALTNRPTFSNIVMYLSQVWLSFLKCLQLKMGFPKSYQKLYHNEITKRWQY